MKNILSFDDFILEESVQLNEGLLQNLFGAILGRDMWSAIKGEKVIKDEFKKIDDKLSGFYLTKIKNPNASQDVRQTLVDWADEIYKAKKKLKEETDKAKEGDDKEKDNKEDGNDILPVLIGSFKFEGKTEEEIKKEIENNEELKKLSEDTKGKILDAWKKVQDDKELSKKFDELKSEVKKIDEKYQKTLDDVTGSSADLKRWANILKDRMNDIIDKILCGKYGEDSELAKDLEKIQDKKDKNLEKKNKDELKDENDQLKKINDERNSVLKKCGVDIVADNVNAENVLKSVMDEITKNKIIEESILLEKKISIEDYSKTKLPKLIGLNVENDKNGESKNYDSLNKTLKTLSNVVLKTVKEKFKTFDSLSGVNFQAMLTAYANLLYACYSEKTDMITDDMVTLMARCAIYNNTVIGFGLPCPDEDLKKKDDEKVSMFGFYTNQLLEYIKKQKKGGLPIFKKIYDDVMKKAKSLIDENNKEDEQKLKEEEKENKK